MKLFLNYLPTFAPIYLMSAVLCFAEHYLLREWVPTLYEASPLTPGRTSLPKAYGLVLLTVMVYTSWNMLGLGFEVGSKRKEFKELAKKKDDKLAEQRFSTPQLYAEGLTPEAIAFNCHQRGHQQALETLAQFMVMGLLGGTVYPVSCGVIGLLWNFGRLQWAEGYARSADERYKGGPLTFFIWIGLAVNHVACFLVALHIMGFALPVYDVAGLIKSYF